jgi:hypothetical protein
MVDKIFQWCVNLLGWLAGATGTTYKQINVIIFCVIWPLLTIALVALCLIQRARIKRLREQMRTGKKEPRDKSDG